MKRTIILSLGAAALLLGACTQVRDVQLVGNWHDPLCAPDSSVVWGVFPNDQGSYNPIKASRENCAWFVEKQGDEPSDVKVAAN